MEIIINTFQSGVCLLLASCFAWIIRIEKRCLTDNSGRCSDFRYPSLTRRLLSELIKGKCNKDKVPPTNQSKEETRQALGQIIFTNDWHQHAGGENLLWRIKQVFVFVLVTERRERLSFMGSSHDFSQNF